MTDQAISLHHAPYAVVTITDSSATPLTKTVSDIKSISVTETENAASKFKLVCRNKNNQFDPDNTSSSYYPFITANVNYTWSITFYNGADVETWDELCFFDVNLSLDRDNNLSEIILIDAGWKLSKKNQTHPSWKSVAGTTVYSTAVLADIATFESMSYTINSSSFPVLLKHYQGEKPMDVIQQILDVTWGKWSITSNTLVTYQPDYKPSGPADYTITDYQVIKNLKKHYSKASVITRCQVLRTAPSSNVCLDRQGSTTDQAVKIDLDFDVIAPFPHIIANRFCTISNWVLFDENGDSGGVWPIGPPLGITRSIQFNVQSHGGLTADEAKVLGWHIRVTGRKPLTDAEWGDITDTTYQMTVINDTLETELGEQIPGEEPVLDENIPNSDWLQTNGENRLKESAKQLRTISGSIGPYIKMKPGETIHTICSELGIDAYYYVETVTKSIDGNSLNVEFTATLPRNDTFSNTTP